MPAETVNGHWPEVAGLLAPADVVVCHDGLYNVPDLEPFARATRAVTSPPLGDAAARARP